MSGLTHFDDSGASRMVDVGQKPVTHRLARASALVRMAAETLRLVRDKGFLTPPLASGKELSKGDVLEVARLAGIMGAKRTADLIPLCHPLALDAVAVSFAFPDETHLAIEATAHVQARTGVEMEALVAASVAALTVYDMCKSIDRGMSIEQVRLEEKSGGQSGHFVRPAQG